MKHVVYQAELALSNAGHGDVNDITDQVSRAIRDSEIHAGICHIFNVGSTGAIGAIEFEPGLKRDLPEALDRLFPPSADYAHEQTWHDGNGHSHLQATLLGPSLTIPVRDRRPVLGTWQQIVHVECDTRERQRSIVVTIMGEPQE